MWRIPLPLKCGYNRDKQLRKMTVKTIILSLIFVCMTVSAVFSQVLEHFSFPGVAAEGDRGNFEYVAGAPVGALSGDGSVLSAEYGNANFDNLLPIELFSFSATCNGKYAEISWTTASERNNDHFSVERSNDAINFTEIARVSGRGNSIVLQNYGYNDFGIQGGYNYYRLVQVDYDGTRTTSEIIVATCIDELDGKPDVLAYPNPFGGELTVVLTNFHDHSAQIEVYDMLGKAVLSRNVDSPQDSYETVLNLGNLPPATYNIRVWTNDFVINKKVIKQ